MRPIRIALTKGRLENSTVALFEKIGYNCEQLRNKGRKLILEIPEVHLEVVLAKAADVITYVEHGVCDMGVVGKDTIMEYGDVEIIKIEGSVELAPLLGLSDGIVDIVETGATLRENGLEVAEDLISLSARLIVNNASLKLRKKELESIISAIQNAVKA